MSESYTRTYKQDLNQPLIRRDVGIIGEFDGFANNFGVTLLRDGERIDATVYDITGYFIRPDEQTVPLVGFAINDTVFVCLTPDCYYFDGAFTLAIKVNDGTMEQTVLICDGVIERTRTDTFADGNIITHTVHVGISSVEQTITSNESGGTNVITVNLMDGSSYQFEVKNGQPGKPEISDEQIAAEIAEYLQKNPIEGGVDEEQLAQAVEEALQEAKASGEFDGVGIQTIGVTRSPDEDGYYYIILNLTDGQQQKIPYKNGKDGVSPSVSVTSIPGGHRVSITDANGTKTFDVMDGGEISDTKLAEAIASYIAENPIVGGVDEEQLNQAVETALQTAKESGKFDGPKGDPGVSGVHLDNTEPTDPRVNVWIDPDGEPSGYEEWEFTLADGSKVIKRVVLV